MMNKSTKKVIAMTAAVASLGASLGVATESQAAGKKEAGVKKIVAKPDTTQVPKASKPASAAPKTQVGKPKKVTL
jgi:hypothetical protein